jgi:hypothetical protein
MMMSLLSIKWIGVLVASLESAMSVRSLIAAATLTTGFEWLQGMDSALVLAAASDCGVTQPGC